MVETCGQLDGANPCVLDRYISAFLLFLKSCFLFQFFFFISYHSVIYIKSKQSFSICVLLFIGVRNNRCIYLFRLLSCCLSVLPLTSPVVAVYCLLKQRITFNEAMRYSGIRTLVVYQACYISNYEIRDIDRLQVGPDTHMTRKINA